MKIRAEKRYDKKSRVAFCKLRYGERQKKKSHPCHDLNSIEIKILPLSFDFRFSLKILMIFMHPKNKFKKRKNIEKRIWISRPKKH